MCLEYFQAVDEVAIYRDLGFVVEAYLCLCLADAKDLYFEVDCLVVEEGNSSAVHSSCAHYYRILRFGLVSRA
jgi:hypothetical protein